MKQVLLASVLLSLELTGSLSAAEGGKEAVLLEAGKTIEREIAGGQVHSYAVALSKGQYARVVVYQRGIDVVVTVIEPDGSKSAEIDNPNGPWGPEEVSLLADAAGTYRLDVSPIFKTASSERYEVRLEELRLATPSDRDSVLAQKLCGEAVELENEGSAESRRKALAKYEAALLLTQATGNRRQEALTLVSIGEVYGYLSERKKELEYYSRALPLVEAVGDSGEVGMMCLFMTVPYGNLSETQKALDFGMRALTLAQAVGNRNGEAWAWNNLGGAYADLGEHQKALGYHSAGLSLARRLGDPLAQADMLTKMGQSYSSLGDGKKALEALNEALPLRRAFGDRREQAVTLRAIGGVYEKLGEPKNSLDYYNQALSLFRIAGDRSGEAAALSKIGSVYASVGETQKALDNLTSALAIRREVANRAGEAESLYQLARVERDRGDLTEARRKIEAAFEIFDSIRARVGSRELRTSYFATMRESYDLYVDLLVQLHGREPGKGYAALAFRASENARAKGLLELLTEARADIRQGIDPVLLGRERALRELLSGKVEAQIRLLSGKHTDDAAAAAAKEIEGLQTQYEQVNVEIRATSPRYAALTQPQPLSLAQAQKQVVDGQTLLLEYALGDDRSYVFAVTPDRLDVQELPRRSEVEAAARRLYELLAARSQLVKGESPEERQARIASSEAEYPKVASALSKMLLGPLVKELGSKRLLIVADGALQYVPFAALPNPAHPAAFVPLGAGHEIVSLPSASILAILRQEIAGRAPPPKTLAVLADPVFEKDDDRVRGAGKSPTKQKAKTDLPLGSLLLRSAQDLGLEDGGKLRIPRLAFTRREAEAIFSLAPAAKRKKSLDFDASLADATTEELGKYRFVHFATHGFLNSLHPELSGVVLSLVDREGKDQDGFLSALEVYNLKLPVDLVVLSGCRTGLGKDVKGEGLVGLTRGFMYAGAARVLVSLWSVDDVATAELMTRFYEGMLGKQRLVPAAALRAAQLSISKQKRWQSPYYWAAFILQGEPK